MGKTTTEGPLMDLMESTEENDDDEEEEDEGEGEDIAPDRASSNSVLVTSIASKIRSDEEGIEEGESEDVEEEVRGKENNDDMEEEEGLPALYIVVNKMVHPRTAITGNTERIGCCCCCCCCCCGRKRNR